VPAINDSERVRFTFGQYVGPGYFIASSFNPLTPELNLSAQRYLPRFFTGDFNF
jgi:hypothetical protein